MIINHFTKDNTLIYKGIGILLIVLHNFFHWIEPMTGENEWDFFTFRIDNLYNGLKNFPLEFINLLFSYFGHYGVLLFIFISGVGLTLSIQNKSRNWGVFMIERLKKLYPLMIVGFVFLFFVTIVSNGELLGWVPYREFIYKLLFLHTFSITKGSALSLSGPWWFFGLIFQLYVLFPFLYKAIKKYNLKAFVVITIFSIVWLYIPQYIYSPKAEIYLLQNAPGQLPVFALGIFFALNPGKRIHFIWGVLALIFFTLGNFLKPFFPLTFISVTVLFFWCISKMEYFVLNKSKILKTVLFYYGSISMILFVIHGPLRRPFITISGDTFWGKLLGAALFLLAVTALSILGKMLYKWLVEKTKFN